MLGGDLKTDHGNVLKRNVTLDKDAYLFEGAPRLVTDTSFIRNPQYHQMSDTIDTLDLPFFCAVVNGLDGALAAL